MRKRLIVAATAATLSLGAAIPLVASAAQAGGTTGRVSLVDQIASKFSLNKADVQKVFDDNRTANQATHSQAFTARLATLVKDGQLTQVQADKIQAKQTEIAAFKASLKSKTPAERQAAMKTERDAVAQWAKANGIDASYLMPGRGGTMGPGGHGGMHSSDVN